MLKNFSLTKRIQYVITAIIMVIILFNFVLYQYKSIQLQEAEREKELCLIASMLSGRFQFTYRDLFIQKGALDKPVKEKVIILNDILQPLVNEVHHYYPNYGMGIYSRELNHNIAIQPFKRSKLTTPPQNSPYLEIYKTGKPKFSRIYSSITWNGAPAISYAVPLFNGKEMIGHVWANTRIDDLNKHFYAGIYKALGICIVLFFIVNHVLSKIFSQLRRKMLIFSESVVKNKPVNIKLLPEMEQIIKHMKKNMDEINKLDRLNLVGQMAAGIGHEVRNPMTTVKGFLQLLKEKKPCAEFIHYFDLMIEEIDRANSIITEFLSMAKTDSGHRENVNLNEIIDTIYPLLEAQALSENKFIHKYLGHIPVVFINEKEIRQVLFNLVNNGLEASPEGASLSIRTYTQDDKVVLEVKDTGRGIDQAIMEKIGNPFVTTKPEGTGLGLATCYSIAERNNASIDFTTSPSGTTFFVRFPAE